MTGLFFLAIGVLTAGVLAFVVTPLMKSGQVPDRRLGLTLIALAPLLVLGLYLALGRPDLAGRLRPQVTEAAVEINAALLAQKPLERQVAQNPRDLEAAVTLGALYHRLGRHAEAVEVFARAATLAKGLPLERVIRRLLEQERALAGPDRP